MKSYTGVFGPGLDIQAAEASDLPQAIHVIPAGAFNTQTYGPGSVTTDHLDQMIKNFKQQTRKMVPIDVDHDGGKAAGWVKDIS